MTSEPPPSRTLRDACVAEHRRLEDLVTDARDALAAGDPALHASRWAACAAGLCRHMDAEERHMLPRLVGSASRLARTLVAEHNHLRARLGELSAPPQSVEQRRRLIGHLLDELRAHARHEEAVLYPWAEENLDSAERGAFLAAR